MADVALRDDLLDGADEIAQYLGKSRTETYYLLKNDQLPGVFKCGPRKWRGFKSKIKAGLEELERKAASERRRRFNSGEANAAG